MTQNERRTLLAGKSAMVGYGAGLLEEALTLVVGERFDLLDRVSPEYRRCSLELWSATRVAWLILRTSSPRLTTVEDRS